MHQSYDIQERASTGKDYANQNASRGKDYANQNASRGKDCANCYESLFLKPCWPQSVSI